MSESRVFNPYKELLQPSEQTVIFVVIDGIAGIPNNASTSMFGRTELEESWTTDFDKLAKDAMCGTHIPLGPGLTPGSVPAHLSIFGYDPFEYPVGRGAVEALGLGVELQPGEIAIRCNFCTLDNDGLISDRRAGRPSSDESAQRVARLAENISVPGYDIKFYPGSEHRFVTVLSGGNLGTNLTDTDPQQEGRPILHADGKDESGDITAMIVDEITRQGQNILADDTQMNGFTMRGYSAAPEIPSFKDRYGMDAVAVATHPVYQGIGRMLGMGVAQISGKQPEDVMRSLDSVWGKHHFYYLHFKWPDSFGENADPSGKAAEITKINRVIGSVMKYNPDVAVVTGDHATPAALGRHSWHPVPVMILGKGAFKDDVRAFTEKETAKGYFGHKMPATNIMSEVLALSGRLAKFGA